MKEVTPQRVHAVRIHLYIVVQKQKMHLHYIKSQRAVDLCYVTACMGIPVTLLLYLAAGYVRVCSVFEVTQLYSYDLCTLRYIFYSSMKGSKIIKKPGPKYFWKIFNAFISLVCRSTRRFQIEKEKRKHLEPQSSKHNHHNTNFLFFFFFGTGFLIES